MSCALRVVAPAVSGHLDVVSHGENGILVPPGSPETLADAVDGLLASEGRRQRLGAEARRTVEEGYTWEAVSERVMACYRRALGLPQAGAGSRRVPAPHALRKARTPDTPGVT